MMTALGLLQFSILLSALCLSSVKPNCQKFNTERNSFFINSDVIYDRVLTKSTFLVTTIVNEVECWMKCLQNCSCLSMNYLKGGQQNNCLLNNSTKKRNPELLEFRASWKYYHFVRENVDKSNTGCINGCCKNNPCLNGGTCIELCANQERRFQCKCKKYHTGYRCEVYNEPPRSCGDLKEDGISKNGWFDIYITPNSRGTKVYCDFRSRDNITWTMVQSFQFNYQGGYVACTGWKERWKYYPFRSYNLGSSEKLVLRNRSSHWRATCEYEKHHTVLDNYIVARHDQIDLTASWPDGVQRCRRFEEINVLETKCRNCSATVMRDCAVGEYRKQYFVLLGKNSTIPSCTGETLNEGYFRSYFYKSRIPANPLFPCYNRYGDSTTQFWFGSV